MRFRPVLPGLIAALGVALLASSSPAGTGSKRRTVKAKPARRVAPSLAMTAPLRLRRSAEEGEAPTRRSDPARQAKVAGKTKRAKKAKPEPDRWPAMRLEAVNTGEKLALRVFDRRGRTIRPAVRRLWHLMRCHLTGKEKPIHWRLVRNLYRISRHYAGRTIYVYSGYRSRRVASLRSSNHVKGRAVDLRVSGISNRALRDYLMSSFKPCGVGYYPNGLFVHFDVREKQSAFWVDYSGKGEASDYASDPYAVLKSEKSEKGDKAAKTKPAAKPTAAQPATEAGADEPPATKGEEADEAQPAEQPKKKPAAPPDEDTQSGSGSGRTSAAPP